MAESKYTKTGLMRKNKVELLGLASEIEFIDEDNTKSEIADAILIMSFPVFEGDEGPGSAGVAEGEQGDPAPPTAVYPDEVLRTGPGVGGNRDVPVGEGIDDPDYPASARVQRIRESQRAS